MLRARLKLALIAVFAFGVAAARADDVPPIPIPDGFVAQQLDVTKGWVARPKDWFYESHGVPGGWLWTISKEDSTKAEYETGMRIQMFVDIAKHGTTPQDLMQGFLKQKHTGATVLSECSPTPAGTFIRQCLETVEPDIGHPGQNFHIQYSAFWPDKGDIAFLVTFGVPEGRWKETQPIEKVMANLVIFGADFGKDEKKKE